MRLTGGWRSSARSGAMPAAQKGLQGSLEHVGMYEALGKGLEKEINGKAEKSSVTRKKSRRT